MDRQKLVAFDIEIYKNYSLFAFKNISNNKTVTIELKQSDASLSDENRKILLTVMSTRTTFGYNSRNYDLPLIVAALAGATAQQLYKTSCAIIERGKPGWMTLNELGLKIPTSFDTFDIQEACPAVRISLKLYGGRLHCRRLQDLPYDPHTELSDNEKEEIKRYCVNDLDTTISLYKSVEDRIELREKMGLMYHQDLRSKSDAQIAEQVIKSELKAKGVNPVVPDAPNQQVKYNTPDFIKFRTSELQQLLSEIESHSFELDAKGSIALPEFLKKEKITIGSMAYKIGVGGLHSTEKKQSINPTPGHLLVDRDVVSYYPTIILNQGLYPKHLGEEFLTVYKDLVKQRIDAKKRKDNLVSNSLKITINGAFGKLGSKYSILYSPELLLQVTLTGQLSLLMLIERLHINNIEVVSANTDGFVTLLSERDYKKYCAICADWEKNTQFILEETRYKAIYSRDVNNYLAIMDGGVKVKGVFAKPGLMKNPQSLVCVKAVRDYLVDGTDLLHTIKENQNVRDFLTVRTVNGGAVFKDTYLGKVVRFIYVKDGDVIRYKVNGNKVAKSDGSRPLMELPDNLPSDIDYERYLAEAKSILETVI